MSSVVDEQQSWLAMQYVLGELSESERDAYEDRMSNDLAICEAVTAASRLVLTARTALELDGRPSPALDRNHGVNGTHSIRSSWLVVAVTSVAMALLCVFSLHVPVRSPSGTNVANGNPAAAELVSLWRSGMNAGEAESDESEDLVDASGEVAVPGWMLAAVSLEAGAVDDSSEKVQEN